jgi:DNA-binding transcriptional regulator YiaG
MEKKYKSELLGAIHEGALANFEVGAISEEKMREWPRVCLVQEQPSKSKALKLRDKRVLTLVSL